MVQRRGKGVAAHGPFDGVKPLLNGDVRRWRHKASGDGVKLRSNGIVRGWSGVVVVVTSVIAMVVSRITAPHAIAY